MSFTQTLGKFFGIYFLEEFKMKTRISGVILTFILIIACSVFLSACSENDKSDEPSKSQDGIVFEQVGEEYSVISYEGKKSTVVIPESFNGKSVTSISDNAFRDKKEITSVTIPETVVSIGDRAFSGCVRLSVISLPGGLKSIGQSAFYKCSSIASITIPSGVTRIERSTFEGCSLLKNVTIPAGVTSIENYAFYKCKALENINFGGSANQWKAISKADAWNYASSEYIINCSDESLKK